MKFRDLGAQYQHLKSEIDAGIQGVLDSNAFILGKPVAELEDQLAEFAGSKYCVSCASGTDALQLVLMSWGIGPGDAVFTSDFTYIASAGTTSVLGATIILVDIDARTYNIAPAALEAAIQKVLAEGRLTPKAIVPVDLFGLPANYPEINAIAAKYNLKVLADGAQAFGGSINGQRVGSLAEASTTSFFPAKPLGCYGDGGAIFTDDAATDTQLRSLRVQGRSPEDKYDNRSIGINSRLDTIQAAILLPKLKAFAQYELQAVNQVAAWYTERLSAKVITPFIPEGYYSSWAQYTIRLNSKEERNALQQKLKENGVPSMIYYPRGIHQQTAYQDMHWADELFPNTIAATQTVLSLPMHPYLDEETVESICKLI